MSIDGTRIGVVVVAYNAETTLTSTLERIPAHFRQQLDEVIILDDASSDATTAHAQEWAGRVPDLTTVVVTHTKNLGYGGNQKAAYALAAERGLDIVVLLHGDGQYAPELLPEMVAPLLVGDADAVFGSRMMEPGAARAGGMPTYKWLGNRVLTRMENRLLGTDLSEFHSGYRAYRVSSLNSIPLEHNSDDFDFDTQIIIQLVDAGYRIVEIPIPTYYGDEICYVNGMKYAWDVMKDVGEYRLNRMGFGTSQWVSQVAEYDLKEGDGSSHSVILDMLRDRPRSRILDLGCSGGVLAEKVRKLGHHVVGVDVIEIPGVRDRVDEFHLLDLAAGADQDLGRDYDAVILGDVIEHLPDPLVTLRRAVELLRPAGEVIISVPNFGHWYPRLRAASGLFGYDRRGILDDTHLRFFTRRSLLRLVRRAGLDVLEERHTGLPLGLVQDQGEGKVSLTRRVDAALVSARPPLFAYQFVLRLRPHVESTHVSVFEATRASSGGHP
ncbi:bifunctional glycosyltransferase/class I SAM-dependent methyltransferase [Nocardioides sp.]|uniref:bifunctional glycosyltransferase/class I SAM-dependent methyltransferase n=1 Tax=Nocardioides sp. TaxID=35761 RepID=UPI002C9D6A37|nr:bifunctional glycosyltransferase/class I SAM-dependent methyltransferase [Nocardioides sp.]HXH77923.1 bifunctional glycosyltransferase/class I SAM-dependent methyltransferase [Nocardioides sp.]